jgi:hypothetical protein
MVAIGLAAFVGYISERMPVSPILQSVGATIVGGLVALASSAVLWLRRATDEAGGAFVSVGFAEFSGVVVGVAVLAVGGHWLLGWLGSALRVPLVEHRPTILALLSGLCGTLPFWAPLRS